MKSKYIKLCKKIEKKQKAEEKEQTPSPQYLGFLWSELPVPVYWKQG